MEQLSQPITHDRFGRMNYHPDFHTRNGEKWTQEERQYIIDFYDFAGAEEIAFALDRTEKTVQNEACKLRKKGLLPPIKSKKKVLSKHQ